MSRPIVSRVPSVALTVSMLVVASAAVAQEAPRAGETSDRSPESLEASPQSFEPSPESQELLVRLDSLRPLLQEARDALSARESRDEAVARDAAASVARVDTLRVGLVTIVTPIEQVDVAIEFFTDVWDEHFAMIERSPSLERARFAFQWSAQRVPIHIAAHGRDLRMTRWTRRAAVRKAIRNEIATALAEDLTQADSHIGRWTSTVPLQGYDLAEIYRLLATRRSMVTRGCIAGDISACSSSMGLGAKLLETEDRFMAWPVPHIDQLRSWYSPDDRRAIVADERTFRFGRFDAGLRRQCLDDSEIAACDRLLESAYIDLTPLPGLVRGSLVAYAVNAGGPGAWERLISSAHLEPTDALEATSGQPIHELVAGWRGEVMTYRPDPYVGLLPRGGLTLAWTLLFAALAMRSTRCRLG